MDPQRLVHRTDRAEVDLLALGDDRQIADDARDERAQVDEAGRRILVRILARERK